MKQVLIFLVLAVVGLSETPDQWFDAFSFREQKMARKRIAFIEANIPGDTTYRKLVEQSLTAGQPMLRYLLKYYLSHDPNRLEWDKHGPFLQVLPCNCGEENSIDSDEFRVLFPPYSMASSAWEKIDRSLRQTYYKLGGLHSDTDAQRGADEAELADLQERFLRLKAANHTAKPASLSKVGSP